MTDWSVRAACKGKPMYPARDDGPAIAACLLLCSKCPVKAECDAQAHVEGFYGIEALQGVWAGKFYGGPTLAQRRAVASHDQERRAS